MTDENGYAYPPHATRRRRVTLALVVVGGVLVLGLLVHVVVRPLIDGYFAALDELMKRDPVAAEAKVWRIVVVMAGLYGSVIVAMGLYLAYMGWQTVRARRWPYPGMKIHRRWKILDGEPAVRRGTLLLVLGLSAVILGPALAGRIYSSMNALAERGRSRSELRRAPSGEETLAEANGTVALSHKPLARTGSADPSAARR